MGAALVEIAANEQRRNRHVRARSKAPAPTGKLVVVYRHVYTLGRFVDELAQKATGAGANKHWQPMRCQGPEAARGASPLQMQRRLWGIWSGIKTRMLHLGRQNGRSELRSPT